MTDRVHFLKPVQDALGNLLIGGTVTLFKPDGSPFADPIYQDSTGPTTRTSPWTSTDGMIDFYLERPQYVNISYEYSGDAQTFVDIPVVSPDAYTQILTFEKAGVLAAGPLGLPIIAEDRMLIQSVRATVQSAPLGQDVLVDLLVDGTSVFDDPLFQPRIVNGATPPATNLRSPAFPLVEPGQAISAEIVTVGTSTPGSDLVVSVKVITSTA